MCKGTGILPSYHKLSKLGLASLAKEKQKNVGT